MRWGIISPMLKRINIELVKAYPQITNPNALVLQISELNFFLIVLSTVMIAAAGYIINDYFDVRLDRINKPQLVIIDTRISRRFAMAAHIILNLMGILIGTYVSYQLGIWKMSVIFPLCAGALWFYSTNFKRQLITGNLLVAFLSALVPLLAGGSEMALVITKYKFVNNELGVNLNNISYFIIGFAFFAFLITLIREIVKDIEDSEGDKEYGCDTIPIEWGIKTAKYIAISICVVTVICVARLQYSQFIGDAILSFYYMFIFIQLPLLFIIFQIFKSNEPKDFHLPSQLIKLLMLLGILYSIVIYLSFSVS